MDFATRIGIAAACLSCLASAAGCATTSTPVKVPQARFAQAEAAIQAADEAGASVKNPSAALHLRMAREESQEAQRLAANRNGRRAETMLIRSVVDADLAKALASAASTRQEAQKVRDQIRGSEATEPPAPKRHEEVTPESLPPITPKAPESDED